MPLIDFVQQNDTIYAAQLTQFAARLPNYTSTFNLVAADVTAAVNDAAFFEKYLVYTNTVVAYGADLMKGKKQVRSGVTIGAGPAGLIVLDPGAGVTGVPPGVDKRFRVLAARIKAHANYSPSIGADLGIAGVHSAPADTPPLMGGVAFPGGVVKLSFKKLGHPGVSVVSERSAETSFTFLASPLRSPYNDTRPNLVAGTPEVRRYKIRYVDSHGNPSGAFSGVLEITTEP